MEGFRQELAENGYMRQVEVTFADCGPDRKMRVGAMLTAAACAAGFDYDARGLTYEVLYRNREIFLLSRLALSIHRCPEAGDVLDLHTWENGVKGAHMQRVYQLRDQSGETRVSMKSDWILVDPVSRKILRPASFTARPIYVCPVDIDCPNPQKVVLPADNAQELGERAIRWSDLDGNGHLFSGNYGDVIWDALPEDLQTKLPQTFFINYSREVTLRDTLRLRGIQEGSNYRMEGVGPNGPCFTALCCF